MTFTKAITFLMNETNDNKVFKKTQEKELFEIKAKLHDLTCEIDNIKYDYNCDYDCEPSQYCDITNEDMDEKNRICYLIIVSTVVIHEQHVGA